MYLTYSEYAAYGGTLSQTDFERAEYAAERVVRNYTFNRIDTMQAIPEAVKRLMFELIDLNANTAQIRTAGNAIKSFNTDGYSETYGSSVASYADVEAQAGDLVRQYLLSEEINGVPLLYCGADQGVVV